MQSSVNTSKIPYYTLLLIAPFFLWGTAMVAMKSAIPNTTAFFVAGVRLVPAGLLVLAAAHLAGRSQPKGWKAWLWISLFAVVDAAMFQGFLAQGLVRTGAGLGSVMIDSQPLAVAILCRFLFAEQIGIWGWLGLLIGVLGISCIGLPDQWILEILQGHFSAISQNFEPGQNLATSLFQSGEWLMLLAALSMALGTVTIRKVSQYADPVVATGWHMIIGGLPLFALSAVTETQQWQNLDLAGWLGLAYATVFGSAIAYGLFFYFASSGNLTSLSALTFLTPVFALLFGNLFLGEMLSPLQTAGVCLTLLSIYLINQRDNIAQILNVKRGIAATENQLLLTRVQDKPAEKIPLQVRLSETETEI
ncbi:DMT family transporter [Ancylothrix sp. C2]|uniref:DMT family transporter n=1 Tax=Ancylothrix sp. D3o TaxID=2953691 RepID=UPI0021BB3AC9|nr:DMT family transporter [Ancylothrix sp. D3o]MCT7948496.1 DMT family transporter [Ancylothrix sp. D3o]